MYLNSQGPPPIIGADLGLCSELSCCLRQHFLLTRSLLHLQVSKRTKDLRHYHQCRRLWQFLERQPMLYDDELRPESLGPVLPEPASVRAGVVPCRTATLSCRRLQGAATVQPALLRRQHSHPLGIPC